jgi:hypothetical protein
LFHLAWNHDDVSPARSRDELLGEVVRRGESLRRRRRVAGGLGGTIALLLAVAGMATLVRPGGEPTTQLAASGATSTLVQNLQSGATGGTTFAVDAPTTSGVPTAAASASRASTTTVHTAAQPAETVPATTTPTVAPATTVPAPAQPRCSAAQMSATITLAPSFSQGQAVAGTAVLRNTSGAPCYIYSTGTSIQFKDASGAPLVGSSMIADNFADTPVAPDQTFPAILNWDQQVCSGMTCGPAAPGTYSATVEWSFDGPPIGVTAAFQIVP